MTLKNLLADREKMLAFLKKNRWILLIGFLGVILLLIPVGRKQPEPVIAKQEAEVFSIEAFEEKLADILSDIQGAGRVRVMLALKNGTETVYATNDSSTLRTGGSETAQSIDKTIVMQSQGSMPVEEKRIYPSFSGAIVVSEGAGKSSIELMIIRAVAAVTGLSTDKISVLPGK